MTKEGFKKGLLVFKTAGLKSAPVIKIEELDHMYNLWNQILRNPDDDKFYMACLKYCESEVFFPAASQIKNIIEGRNPYDKKFEGIDPYAHFPRF